MDDDRTLAEASGDPVDAVDEAFLAQVNKLFSAIDPVPDDLVERITFAMALDEVFDEVARVTRMPVDSLAVRSESPAGTRTETLTFSATRLTAMVTVVRMDRGLRLDGWLAPPEACRVRLRIQDGPQYDVLADAQGRFSFQELEEGFGQLSFHPLDDEGSENAVVTPLFQL
ncbi:MAG: hypothetical protein HOQ22_03900 [Nocardioidaceae bacterium]|nr:hypothetical protein [Nocardioidaceae bacterium]NUS50170.1 hypothetical protein [Nocardioidaceae bacterium]